MDTDSDGQISVAELIAWVKKNSEEVGHVYIDTFLSPPYRRYDWRFTLGATRDLVLFRTYHRKTAPC